MSAPAKAGPTNMDSCAVPWTMALPVWSRSLPISFGTMADCAGKKKASANPKSRAKAIEHPELDDASEGESRERRHQSKTARFEPSIRSPRR